MHGCHHRAVHGAFTCRSELLNRQDYDFGILQLQVSLRNCFWTSQLDLRLNPRQQLPVNLIPVRQIHLMISIKLFICNILAVLRQVGLTQHG
jgi:hypothetical protein